MLRCLILLLGNNSPSQNSLSKLSTQYQFSMSKLNTHPLRPYYYRQQSAHISSHPPAFPHRHPLPLFLYTSLQTTICPIGSTSIHRTFRQYAENGWILIHFIIVFLIISTIISPLVWVCHPIWPYRPNKITIKNTLNCFVADSSL